MKQEQVLPLEDLTRTQIDILKKIIASFRTGVEVKTNPESDLCSAPNFADYFSNLFSVYHTITEHKFGKKSFEFAFKYACIACGIESHINSHSSHQGEDVTRGKERISLKTEGENTETTFKISKFSEARFIAKYKTENQEKNIRSFVGSSEKKRSLLKALANRRNDDLSKLVQEVKGTIQNHLDSYDRIIGLKANAIKEGDSVSSYKYRLIEIPMPLIRQSLNISVDDFKPLKGNGGTSAVVKEGGKRKFGITIDGSVEKISFTGIKISDCIMHAEFMIPVSVSIQR